MQCPICQQNTDNEPIFQFNPQSSSISGTNKISFSLTYCADCHHLYNADFEPDKIDYSDVQFETFFNHSDFQKSIQTSIEILSQFIHCEDVSVFDFGCGDGSFLDLTYDFFSRTSHNVKTLGYEIGKFSQTEQFITDSLLEFKTEISVAKNPVLVARHVIEHLDNFDEFFSVIPKTNCLIYIEVPNGSQAITQHRFEDLVYEHVSYFSFESLHKLVSKYGLVPLSSFVGLNGENIGIICKSNGQYEKQLEYNLKSEYQKQKFKYEELEQVLKDDAVAFWGIGGRCRTILNNVGALSEKDLTCMLLDSDPTKSGSVLAGFQNTAKLPNKELLKSVKLIVIGSRVGKGSILKELDKLKYNGSVILWDEIATNL